MGFPVGYSELPIPRILLHAFYLAGFLRNTIFFFFKLLGLAGFLEQDDAAFQSPAPDLLVAVRDLLPPAERVEELAAAERRDGCAVCLCEFESLEEVGRPAGCRHVFHRRCLERWVEHEQMTCPLCRGPLVLEEDQASLKRRMWAATAAAAAAQGGDVELQTMEMAEAA